MKKKGRRKTHGVSLIFSVELLCNGRGQSMKGEKPKRGKIEEKKREGKGIGQNGVWFLHFITDGSRRERENQGGKKEKRKRGGKKKGQLNLSAIHPSPKPETKGRYFHAHLQAFYRSLTP